MDKLKHGTRLDLTAHYGQALGPFRHNITTPRKGAFDLTGCHIRGVAWLSGTGSSAVPLDVVPAPDLTLGYYDFGLSRVKVNKLYEGAGPVLWKSELVLKDGRVVPLYHGTITIKPD